MITTSTLTLGSINTLYKEVNQALVSDSLSSASQNAWLHDDEALVYICNNINTFYSYCVVPDIQPVNTEEEPV